MSRRQLACAGLGAGIALLVVSSPCVWLVYDGIGRDYTTWEDLGCVQVLGGPDEVWIFLQIDRQIRIPGTFVSAPVRSVGHRQALVRIHINGQVQHIEAAQDDGPTFHPNLGRVFVDGDDVLLLGERGAAFVWRTDRFDPLPPGELKSRLGVDGPTSVLYRVEALEAATTRSGWSTLQVEHDFLWHDPDHTFAATERDGFTWSGRTFDWELSSDGTTVSLVERGGRATRTPLVTTIDPVRRTISRADAYKRR